MVYLFTGVPCADQSLRVLVFLVHTKSIISPKSSETPSYPFSHFFVQYLNAPLSNNVQCSSFFQHLNAPFKRPPRIKIERVLGVWARNGLRHYYLLFLSCAKNICKSSCYRILSSVKYTSVFNRIRIQSFGCETNCHSFTHKIIIAHKYFPYSGKL